MVFKLPIDSLPSLYVIVIGFLAVNTELSGTTRQVPGFYLIIFLSFVSFRKNDWHASDPAHVLSQLCSACFVLGARC
jgi:hypothetical protein